MSEKKKRSHITRFTSCSSRRIIGGCVSAYAGVLLWCFAFAPVYSDQPYWSAVAEELSDDALAYGAIFIFIGGAFVALQKLHSHHNKDAHNKL